MHLKGAFKALRERMSPCSAWAPHLTSRISCVVYTWLYIPPYPGCELSGDEFAIVLCRYYGCADTVLAPHVGTQFQRWGRGEQSVKVDKYGVTLANANVGGDC